MKVTQSNTELFTEFHRDKTLCNSVSNTAEHCETKKHKALNNNE